MTTQRDQRVTLMSVALAAQQLSLMMGQGINVVKALEVAATGAHPPLSSVLREVMREVRSGQQLSRAMGRYPQAFGPMFLLMVKVGEQTGGLVKVLAAVGETLRRADETRLKLKSALTYPAFVLGSSLLMVTILVTYMLPSFVGMFAAQNVAANLQNCAKSSLRLCLEKYIHLFHF